MLVDSSASVRSIDAIRELRAALVVFCHEARTGLVDVELEVRRSLQWIREQQPAHWHNQIRLRENAVNEAKNELHRARMRTLPGGGTPSCMEEKKLLDRAQRRLAEAHEKLEVVARWSRTLAHEVLEYEARAAQLNNYLDATVPRATSFLSKIETHLEAYVGVGKATTSGKGAKVAAAAPPADGEAAQNPPEDSAEVTETDEEKAVDQK